MSYQGKYQDEFWRSYKEPIWRLFGNWGKSVSDKQMDAWLGEISSGGWSASEVDRAVTRCIRDRMLSPDGFAVFAKYLPPRRSGDDGEAKTLPHWHNDGTWGGDWSGVSDEGIREAAVQMVMHQFRNLNRASIDRFLDLAASRGISEQEIRQLAAKKAEASRRGMAVGL